MLNSPTGAASWMRVSPIEVLVTRACDPSLHEPNYALHLDVAEHIKSKKANNPREAAMLIARFANHRNPHIAILALALLDTLVQSCGYPFHLQISSKEFLNELVRRFPERPPPFPGPVMSRILELINSWKEGICVDSRWKDDLGNIRDMHRLLTFKGYRFRDSGRPQSLASASNLKSAEELEEEDREAQSAKLQELIRRGTPRDLAAAQELMKVLAGANPDAKPDYRTEALTELNKLEQKVILLNEMLDNVDTARGERFASGDAYDQVASILSTARPKLQKWINDAETDDSESLDTFLQMNDQINSVLSRYDSYKKGDYTAAANPIPAELSNAGKQNETSLIDLDESATNNNSGTINDLADLFASSPPIQQPSANSGSAGVMPLHAPLATVGTNFGTGLTMGGAPAFNSLNRTNISPPQLSGTPPASIMLPNTPSHRSTPAPNYFSNGGNSATMFPGLVGGNSQQPPLSQQQSPQPTNTSNSSNQPKDPFADLAGLF